MYLSKVFRLALFVLGGELLRNILNRNTFSGFLGKIAVAWHFGNIYAPYKLVMNFKLLCSVFARSFNLIDINFFK